MRADQKEITNWLSKTIGNNSFNIEELRQEASDRKYYRIKAENVSYVLADNFDKTDQSANFLYASKILKNSSVNVPEVLAFSEDLRFLLLQDLGDKSLDTNKEFKDEKILEMALDCINNDKDISSLRSQFEKKQINQSGLLSLKPKIFVCNVDEKSIQNGNDYTKKFISKFGSDNTLIISADIENQINNLDVHEKKIIWK